MLEKMAGFVRVDFRVCWRFGGVFDEAGAFGDFRDGRDVEGISRSTWIDTGFHHILPLGLDRICFILGLFLLHGMGFASVMKELDIPGGELIKPLIGFNLGVEVGQVTVLALAFAANFWFITHSKFRIVSKIASAFIARVGLYWTYERVFP